MHLLLSTIRTLFEVFNFEPVFNHKRFKPLALLLLLPAFLAAQPPADRPIRRYYTQIMNQAVNAGDIDYGETLRTLERTLYEKRELSKADRIEVPVIFHVLYAPGQAYPNGEQIWWQLAVLNQDFAGVAEAVVDPKVDREGFAGRLADTEISFCIARNVVSGKQITDGITYTQVKTAEWGPDWSMCSTESGGVDPVLPDRYLNVWVVNLADTVSGWATYPALGELGKVKPGYTDGIVIGFDFFGQSAAQGGTALPPYDGGKTLTHLVGNYLGLYDLWNEFALCADDYIDDTPIHNAPNYGCQEYKHVSTCHEQEAEMVMNFMDNSDDACQSLFTLGQKARMQGLFAPDAARAGLLLSQTLCETEPPMAAFTQAVAETAVELPAASLQLAVWPNPARQSAQLELRMPDPEASTLFEILIYNVQGQLQRRIPGQTEGGRFQEQLDTSTWPAGVYLLQVHTAVGAVTTRLSVHH